MNRPHYLLPIHPSINGSIHLRFPLNNIPRSFAIELRQLRKHLANPSPLFSITLPIRATRQHFRRYPFLNRLDILAPKLLAEKLRVQIDVLEAHQVVPDTARAVRVNFRFRVPIWLLDGLWWWIRGFLNRDGWFHACRFGQFAENFVTKRALTGVHFRLRGFR
uniref:(northern house mosquito) hypothetical protein n=1 Tax=Culex pipiens TaxID=7175 RepID=A0A8D8CXN5_CULPI